MEFIFALFGLFVCVLFIWICWKVANEFFFVAIAKGYDDTKYLWYCFWFGIVGYLLVIALPDKTKTSTEKETSQIIDELPEI